ncbi:MAG: hypothetical protein WCI11_07250 [Candidatus Methylumidiphilus sp.]|nr:hypothetical protein [Pseudomonadota bacterium]
METHYISRTSDCWLKVQLVGGLVVSLPYGLKVKRLELKNEREYFEILEGVNKGKKASVPFLAGNSYLTTKLNHNPATTVRFDRKLQTLYFAGRGPCNAFSGGGHGGYTPVAPGNYQLAIPAYPSAQTRAAYNTWTKYHNSWFRIGTDTTGSRFLHAGVISEGCVTVRQFIYDPNSGVAPPPAGFSDLVQGAKTVPGLLGLPLPAKPAPVVGWDDVFESLILCRLNDQAIGTLVVT